MNRFPSLALLTVILLVILPLAAWPQDAAAGELAREADLLKTMLVTSPALFPNWVFDDRTQIGSLLGGSAAVAGDLNGDGFDDILVGAERFSLAVETEGAAFVFLGSPTGLSNSPTWTTGGGLKGARYGGAVAGAGDINGDGFDDLMVGARRFNPNFPEEGAVFVFHGSETGPQAVPNWTFLGGQKSAMLGSAVAGAGDINRDGFDDVLVGAPLMESNLAYTSEGVAFLFLGSASGLAADPAWSCAGGLVGAQFGAALAGAGDVNGDGFDDFIVGAPNPVQYGLVALFYGAADGPASEPGWTASDGQTAGRFGTALAGATDLNADGFDDIVIGAPSSLLNDLEVGGVVYVYLGSPDGPSSTPDWVLSIYQPNAQFGASVSAAGDANGDGLDDILVGAPNYSQSKPAEGALFLFPGNTGGRSSQPFWKTFGAKADALLGSAVSGSGDFNHDHRIDLVAGAPEYNLDTFTVGRSMAYYGQDMEPPPIDLYLPILYQTP